MMIIILLLLMITMVMGLYIYSLRAEIRRMSSHIKTISETETNGEVYTLTCSRDFRHLAQQINAMLREQRRRQVQLKRVDAAFKESVAGLSHDLRTPLTSVSGYLQMLQDPATPPEKAAEYFKTINRRLESLLTLLDELFEFTKIELDHATTAPEPVNLCESFLNQLTMYYEEFESRGIEPILSIPQSAVHVSCEKRSLERIFQNLIKNALVHGTGKFSASVEVHADKVHIEVANSADHLQEVDTSRLFERFYTSDKSRSGRGTGLGLAIVKRLAENMGGSVSADASGDMLRIKLLLPLGE